MADLMDLIQGQLSDGLIDQLSQQLGGATLAQTKTAATGILSTLISAMAKNATAPDGASALANALDTDHDGGILDSISDILGGKAEVAPQQKRALNGMGILRHVLEEKQGGAIDMISQMSGLSGGNTFNLMAMLAPIVMGMLGKQKRQQNLDSGGLAEMLTRSVQSASSKRQEMGLVGKLIDRDGDGSVMDDLAGMGFSVLGKFLRR